MTAMAAEPATNRSERIWLFAYLAFFVALSFVKAPNVLIEPRFWAEDGAFYFTDFRTLGAWGALVYVTNGNYQLLTNLLVYLATKVPLAHAPAVTTYGAYLVEALVVVLIHAVVVGYGINRPVGLLLVAAWTLMPASYETWASATNVQWICSVSMLLMLMLPHEVDRAQLREGAGLDRGLRVDRRALVHAGAGLSGARLHRQIEAFRSARRRAGLYAR